MTLGARAVTGGLALALLLPAAAEAAVLAPLKPCYISPPDGTPESVALHGAGFTPGSSVDIAVDGVPVEQNVFVEADGSFGGNGGGVPAPRQARGQRPFTVTVAERGNPANIVSASSQVVALGVRVSPSDVRPRRRVRFSGAGFTGPGPVFGHYARRGRLRRTVRLARPAGTVRDLLGPAPHDPGPAPRARPVDAPDRPGARLPARADERDLVHAGHRGLPPRLSYQASAAARASAGVRVNASSPSTASTSTWSPAVNSPWRSPRASRSTRCFWITRLSGRAP